jgi:hypothetical protein
VSDRQNRILTSAVLIIGITATAFVASYCAADRLGTPAHTPIAKPHPRVMEATRPLVVYTVERPAPRARVWAIEERAAWYERPQEAAQPPVVAQPVPEATPQPEAPPVAVQEPPIVIPDHEANHMGALTRDDVRAAARAAGWPASEIENVVRVAECESGLRPWEVGAAGEVGVLQIHPIHRELHAKYDLRDPVQNMAAGLEVWRSSGWRAWACA